MCALHTAVQDTQRSVLSICQCETRSSERVCVYVPSTLRYRILSSPYCASVNVKLEAVRGPYCASVNVKLEAVRGVCVPSTLRYRILRGPY